jgi:hypothetical protein
MMGVRDPRAHEPHNSRRGVARRPSAQLANPFTAQGLDGPKAQRADRLLSAAHHEGGHIVLNRLAGARALSVTVATFETRSESRTNVAGLDLVDQLVGYAGGRAAVAVFGWPNPDEGAADDARHERMLAIQLAHLSPYGRASDLEYVDAIVDAGREEALRRAQEHWQAIDEVAQVLVRRYRLAGPELEATLDRALLAVPEVRQREDALAADFEWLNVRLGFARPMRSYA